MSPAANDQDRRTIRQNIFRFRNFLSYNRYDLRRHRCRENARVRFVGSFMVFFFVKKPIEEGQRVYKCMFVYTTRNTKPGEIAKLFRNNWRFFSAPTSYSLRNNWRLLRKSYTGLYGNIENDNSRKPKKTLIIKLRRRYDDKVMSATYVT